MAQGLDQERRKRLAARFSTPAPKAVSYNRFARAPIETKDNVTPVIARLIGGLLKDTAESVGQVSNEYVNQTLVGSLLGQDFLSKQVDKINPDAGESMRGEVTPMDIVNVASLIPNPFGIAARGAVGLGRVASKIPTPVFKPVFEPIAAMVGGGTTTRTPVGGILQSILNSTGTKVGTNLTAPGINIGSRIENPTRTIKDSSMTFAMGSDVVGMATQKNYKRFGDYTRTVASRQAKKAGQRYNAKVSATQVRQWAGEMFNKNSQDRLNGFVDVEDINMGHPLNKKRLDTDPPTHYVYAPLNRAAEALLNSGKVSRKSLKSGEDYSPIIRYILDNPDDITSKTVFNATPGLSAAKTFEEAADILVANHLILS